MVEPDDSPGILEPRLFLESGRLAIDRAFDEGASPHDVVRRRAELYDQLLCHLFDEARAEAVRRLGPADGRMCLCAVGGYGRAELSPGSDLDVLFLYPDERSPEVEAISERILYRLWDLGLEVGAAVRSIDACVRIARSDLSAYTSMLDHRLLVGDPALYTEFEDVLFRSVFAHGVTPFLEMRRREDERRRARYAGSIYLLEPNIKQGEGGLRDLHQALWAARVRFRVIGLDGLLRVGAVSPKDERDLAAAHDFLLRVREHLHRIAGRKEDRLTFEYQDRIASALGYADGPGELAVEAFMQRYYQSARTVRRIAGRILERCAVSRRRAPPHSQPIGTSFRLFEGALGVQREDLFRTRPVTMLEIFAEAAERDLPLLPYAKDLLSESVMQVDEALRQDPEAAAHFLRLVANPNDRRNSLAEMHDLGLLGTFVPELAHLTGKHQHTLYHVFTVDVHTLTAIDRLRALHRGDLEEVEPHLSDVMRGIERPRPLYLAVLFHDVGKGTGRDHSVAGAELARTACRRLGLTPDEIEEIEQLVLRHLYMVKLATRRDLHDVALLEQFCGEIGDVERLSKLYVLTYVDSVTTGPNVWSNWKASLVRELYEAARAHLRGEATREATVAAEANKRRARAVSALIGSGLEEDEARQVVTPLPDRYFLAFGTDDVIHHAPVVRARNAGNTCALEPREVSGAGYTELVVSCPDRPGLLSLLTGAMAAAGLDILAARIFTRADGNTMDVFYLRPLEPGREHPRTWQRLREDVTALLSGEATVEALFARRKFGSVGPKIVPRVPTRVEVDEATSTTHSIVDVLTEDRPGLLYLITRTLFELGLTIEISKIATEANRAIDAFYVREVGGGKLGDAARIEAVKARLREVLGGYDPRGLRAPLASAVVDGHGAEKV